MYALVLGNGHQGRPRRLAEKMSSVGRLRAVVLGTDPAKDLTLDGEHLETQYIYQSFQLWTHVNCSPLIGFIEIASRQMMPSISCGA
jgi:hypothetical protein